MLNAFIWGSLKPGQVIKIPYEFQQEGRKPRRFLVIGVDEDNFLLHTCSMTGQIQKYGERDDIYVLKEDQHSLLTKETVVASDDIVSLTKQDLNRAKGRIEIGEDLDAVSMLAILRNLEKSKLVKKLIKREFVRPLIEELGGTGG